MNTLAFGSVSSACCCAYVRYAATAASISGERFAAVPPVALTWRRMPSPRIPGWQAIS
ncbi:hypothetical protein [Streptomyces wuyuanensis]|uniref:hypothetical protein n=1 Tax=Streptomyces wuyuanensis TaxID=1196353 RepID=UPI003711E16E